MALIPLVTIACSPAMLSGILGWRQIQVISVIKKAYSLWKAGSSIRAALSAATGGWGWLVSLLAQFGLAYLASQAFSGSWVVGY
ncbi:hypothetical protein [Enterococcus sp. DIV0724b]|uniref:hypothetical protein n=1 Tax=Enterococcus sp. DIV0724b TaxID=2774694 RepID=UPI003D2FA7A5